MTNKKLSLFDTIVLSSKDVRPRYQQLGEGIRNQILRGNLSPGDKLPTEQQMCEEWGISRQTVLSAITPLVEEGLLERRPRLGTFVAKDKAFPQHEPITEYSRTIGIVVDRHDMHGDSFYNEVIGGMVEAAQPRGYHISLLNFDEQTESVKRGTFLQETLNTQVVDAIVITSTRISHEDTQWLRERKVPYLHPGYEAEDGKAVCIVPDYADGMSGLIQHLVDLGHRDFAIMGGDKSLETIDKVKYETAVNAMAGLDITFDESNYYPCAYHRRDDLPQQVESLLSKSHLPSVILAADDLMALHISSMLQARDYRVPHDIAVVGCNNHTCGSICYPPLTTLHFDRWFMGKKAIEACFTMLRCQRVYPPTRTIAMEMVVRQSCGADVQQRRNRQRLSSPFSDQS